MTYVAGFLIPVPDENREAYVATARKAWEIFRDYGALQVMEAWSEHVPEGRWTDFRRAVDLKPGETVCFSWMIWPDKASYEACGASVETDPRWQELDMPFDGKRMIWGGFEPIFSESA